MEKSLDREFYFSDEIYHQELENIFHSDWICCGREEDIDSIGSYKIFEIGNENFFIIKDKNNDITNIELNKLVLSTGGIETTKILENFLKFKI